MVWTPENPEPTAARYRCPECGLTVSAARFDNVQSGTKPDATEGVAFAAPQHVLCVADGYEMIRERDPSVPAAVGTSATGAT